MDPVTQALVAAIFLFAVTTQATAGFGLGMISLPLLVPLVGIRTAAPVVALVNMIAIAMIFTRYRRSFSLRQIKPLVISATFGIPLGVYGIQYLPESITLSALGALILGYALYAFFIPKMPPLKHVGWAYALGLLSGIFGGAYNSSGPPVILYAHSRNWEPDVFRGNLQAFFVFNASLINITHFFSGNFTASVLYGFLLAVPGIILGLVFGYHLSRRLNARGFRKLVLALLCLLGIRMIAANAF